MKKSPLTAQRRCFNDYRCRSTARGMDFKLTYDEALVLFLGSCYYCGVPPFQTKKYRGRTFTYNGIDRVDNLQGYTNTNTVSCCRICNVAKNQMGQQDFLKWVEQVYLRLDVTMGFR